MSQTTVCITIDTEFDIAGAFAQPLRCRPVGEQAVRYAVEGREEGLGFLLDSFANAGVRATFFVETLQSCFFGDLPMGRLVDRIAGSGHDIELHFHPCWLHFLQPDWATRTAEASDACSGLSAERLDQILSTGLNAFSSWGLDRPVAARTGNLEIDLAVYRAFERFAIPISSSVGLALHEPDERSLRQYAGRHWIENTLEVPVLSFHALRMARYAPLRLLTITACSFGEIETILWRARRAAISPVVLLTHASEFVKRRNMNYHEVRPNRVNQRRLLDLLRFLRRNSDDFKAVTFRESATEWLAQGGAPAVALRGSLPRSLGRMVENFVNDHVWLY
jgi:hypothetical protein